MDQNIFGQINADEHHLADALFALTPIGAQIAAHQLVHALENHLFLGTFHVEHAFVAQHLGAIDVDDGTQEIFEFCRVEFTCGFVDKALYIIVIVVMVAMVAMLVMHMARFTMCRSMAMVVRVVMLM